MNGQYELSKPSEIELIANDLVVFLKEQYPNVFEHDIDYLVGGTLRMAKYILDCSATKRDIDFIVPDSTIENIKNSKIVHATNYFGGVSIKGISEYQKKHPGNWAGMLETKVDFFSLNNFAKNSFRESATIKDYVNGTTYNIEGLAYDIKNKRLYVSDQYDTKILIRQSTFGDTNITKERGRLYQGIYGITADDKTKEFLKYESKNLLWR